MCKFLLVFWLIASSDCGAVDMINKAICVINMIPLKWMLDDAKKNGKLNLNIIQNAINDKKCGGDFPLTLFPPNLLAAYYLSKSATDVISKLFDLQIGLKTTILDGKVNFYRDLLFDYSLKINVNTDTTIKPAEDGATFTIKDNVALSKDGAKLDVNNPFVDKFQELTGINLNDMSANYQSKICNLGDGTINLKATPNQLELSYSTSGKLGNTGLSGSIGLVVDVNPKTQKAISYYIPEAVASAKEAYEQYIQSPQRDVPTTAMIGAAAFLAIAASTVAGPEAAVATATISGPMLFLFGSQNKSFD